MTVKKFFILMFLCGKNGSKVFKICSRYRSENNFVKLSKQVCRTF